MYTGKGVLVFVSGIADITDLSEKFEGLDRYHTHIVYISTYIYTIVLYTPYAIGTRSSLYTRRYLQRSRRRYVYACTVCMDMLILCIHVCAYIVYDTYTLCFLYAIHLIYICLCRPFSRQGRMR